MKWMLAANYLAGDDCQAVFLLKVKGPGESVKRTPSLYRAPLIFFQILET